LFLGSGRPNYIYLEFDKTATDKFIKEGRWFSGIMRKAGGTFYCDTHDTDSEDFD
jgi:hypothetical protein